MMTKQLANEQSIELTTLFDGQLQLMQPTKKSGYRSTLDALLLPFIVYHYYLKPHDLKIKDVLDLGTGAGTIGLQYLYYNIVTKAVGIEYQQLLHTCAKQNAQLNQLNLQVIHSDINALNIESKFGIEKFDCILFNPPYFNPNANAITPNESKAIAKFEIKATIIDFFLNAFKYSHDKTIIGCILPSIRVSEILHKISAFTQKNNYKILEVECRSFNQKNAHERSVLVLSKKLLKNETKIFKVYNENSLDTTENRSQSYNTALNNWLHGKLLD